MKKFRGYILNSNFFQVYSIPIIVISFFLLAGMGYDFSSKLVSIENPIYTIKIKYDDEIYLKHVGGGSFSDTVKAFELGSIECDEGNLELDSLTGTISKDNVTDNIQCEVFVSPDVKKIEIKEIMDINDNKGKSSYFRGDSENNYLFLNGLMFRIVRYNGDGTIRIVLNESYLTANYGSTLNYKDSNVRNVLNNWFNNNFSDKTYVVKGDYDVTNYVYYDTYNLINFEGYYEDYVGLLSVKEVDLITNGLEETYLDSNKGIYFSNGYGSTGVWAFRNNHLEQVDSKNTLLVKPVINIKADDLLGTGTKSDPYKLKEE